MLPEVVFASLLAFTCCASASYNGLEKRAFSVPHSVPAGRHQYTPEALRKAYLKHGIELPEALSKRQLPPPTGVGSAPQATGTGSVIAVTQKNDLEYLSPVNIGGTTMQLDFDTGSSDLWVFSDKLPTQQRNGHTWYALANTTSGQVKEGFSWKISYGDGSGASGIVLADKVTVGEVTATQQAIEAATSVSSQFIQEKSDGLLGLGFGNTNTIKPTKQLTFFENIKPSLKEPLFTVTLKLNESGVYDFGYVDKAKYVEPIQYVPINTTRGYWEYTATGYAVGTGPMTPMNFQSIADTGTTLMLLPPAATADYYSQVKGAMNNMTEGGYVFPCDAVMPDLTVQMLGNVSAVVSGKFMNRSKSQTPGSPFCYGGIQQGSPNLSIWGDVFLKSQFAVFDGRDPPRIGFAKQSGSLGTPLPPANASLPLAQGGNTAVSGSQSGTTRPDPLNWMGYFLKLAKKFGIVPEVHGNGVIAQKRSMRWRHRVVEAY